MKLKEAVLFHELILKGQENHAMSYFHLLVLSWLNVLSYIIHSFNK